MSLELSEGKVKVNFDLGSGVGSALSANRHNDGRWKSLTMSRNKKQGTHNNKSLHQENIRLINIRLIRPCIHMDPGRWSSSSRLHGKTETSTSTVTVAGILCWPHLTLLSYSHPLKWNQVCNPLSAWIHVKEIWLLIWNKLQNQIVLNQFVII